jgi:hypothetical protein
MVAARQAWKHRGDEKRSYFVEAETARLTIGVKATRAERLEVILAEPKHDPIERGGAAFIALRDDRVQRKRD